MRAWKSHPGAPTHHSLSKGDQVPYGSGVVPSTDDGGGGFDEHSSAGQINVFPLRTDSTSGFTGKNLTLLTLSLYRVLYTTSQLVPPALHSRWDLQVKTCTQTTQGKCGKTGKIIIVNQTIGRYTQEESYLDDFPMTRSASNRQEFRTTNVMDCINLNILVIANIQEINERLAH
ncbi:hypothetical protein ACROYT_G019340 [Oculina patagonica]